MENEIKSQLHFWDKLHIENNDLALAKEVYSPETNRTKYFIKVDGIELCNPLNYISGNFWVGRKKWVFKAVNKQCYDMYVLFVKSKNELYLRNAEREYISQ